MRRRILLSLLALASVALTGCETAGYVDSPVEYAVRPDYRDGYRRPPIRYDDRYDRYDRYRDYRDPYVRRSPPPVRTYRPYDRYRDYYDGY